MYIYCDFHTSNVNQIIKDIFGKINQQSEYDHRMRTLYSNRNVYRYTGTNVAL